jgi:glycosyltransferase involved in cell wall biosynthesis
MKIAQVAPLFESVPPKLYGGTERIISYLTEELVREGHEVTLFASADSVTAARLIPGVERALRLDSRCGDHLAWHYLMFDEVFRRSDQFDVIHFHTEYLHVPLANRSDAVSMTTLHGRLDLPEVSAIYKRFSRAPLISISNSQRRPIRWANWLATVYHGLPVSLLRGHRSPGTYLSFLGRISPEKRVDRAIQIALELEIPLKIAAKVDPVDREYFEAQIKPLFSSSLVEYLGEISEQEKAEFLGNSIGLLFPIDWPEPFGLAMIEAMGCGTPVVAFNCGSVKEVVDPGVTGYIVDNISDAVRAVRSLANIDRMDCRRQFERRFTAHRMAQEYVAMYSHLLSRDNVLHEVVEEHVPQTF